MKIKILAPTGINGRHVTVGEIVDVTKEDANTLFAYGKATEATDEDLAAAAAAAVKKK